jgi:putative methyltransferase (TIGR04325 family)
MPMTTFIKVGLADTFIGDCIGRIPFIKTAYKRSALFRRNHSGLFYGVYDSYEQALADIPASCVAGWDNEGAASIWVDNISPMRPGTYPVLFWLSQLLHEGTTVIDYGGSIGLTYYGYQRFARLPANTRWVVVEVPKIVAEGRRVAARESAAGLEFETESVAAPACDILLSAGALQYMKDSVPGLLELWATMPRHLILNKVPLTPKDAYWTLQNFGPSISPYRVYNEVDFLGYFEKYGYVLKDRWGVYELDCYIPFHPSRCLPHFAGLYFEKAA